MNQIVVTHCRFGLGWCVDICWYGGCRKFLLLFGRIGPLALRPCALLRAWGFLPHSINILQIPLWYGDMMWYGVSCARPCALLRGPAFLMPLYHALKILSPPKMWLKGRGFYKSPYNQKAIRTWKEMKWMEMKKKRKKMNGNEMKAASWQQYIIRDIINRKWGSLT